MKPMRIPFPPGLFHPATILSRTPSFIKDVKELLKIPVEQIELVSKEIKQLDTFISPDQYGRKLAEFPVLSDENRELLKRFADNLLRTYAACDERITEGLPRFKEELEKNEEIEKDAAEAARRLSDLFSAKCFNLQLKAKNLKELHPSVEKVTILADLRPIFDDDRTKILGVFPRFTLLISTDDDDEFDIQLSEHQLDKLADQVAKAKSKLQSIQRSLESWGVASPDFNSEDD